MDPARSHDRSPWRKISPKAIPQKPSGSELDSEPLFHTRRTPSIASGVGLGWSREAAVLRADRLRDFGLIHARLFTPSPRINTHRLAIWKNVLRHSCTHDTAKLLEPKTHESGATAQNQTTHTNTCFDKCTHEPPSSNRSRFLLRYDMRRPHLSTAFPLAYEKGAKTCRTADQALHSTPPMYLR